MEVQKTTEDFFEKKYTYQLLDSLKKVGDYYSPAAKPLQDSINQILKEQNNWKLDFIDNNKNILGYHLLCESITYDEGLLDQKRAFETFESFKQLFPEHPYTREFEEVINGKTNAKIGNPFIDFVAPTLSGEQKKLSELINDKLAVIDLWGSWCAPCIVKSNKLIPVYNKYQDKAFTIVGIAAEFGDTNQLKKALERHKYPWINLVELDNAQDIWKKYGILGGGAIILVDEKGEIIAINPSAHEVELEIKKRI